MRKGRHVLLLLFFLIICYFLSTVSQLYLHNWEKVRILWRLKNYIKTSTAWEHWGIRLDKNISMSQIHLKLKHTDFKLLNILLGVLFHQEPVKWDLFFYTLFSWLNIKILPYHASETYMYLTWIRGASILRLWIKYNLQDKLCPEEQVCILMGVRKRLRGFFIYPKTFFPDVTGRCVESHQKFNSFKFLSPIQNVGMLTDKKITG